MLSFAAKLLVSFALVYWLLQKGQIDFSLLLSSLQYKLNWIIGFFMILMNFFVASYRWKRILEIKSKSKLSYVSIFKFNWIGCLFNTVLPGIVSGDFIKLLYVRSIDNSMTKTFLITSVLMDRILGLFGLLCVLGIATIVKYNELIALSPAVNHLMNINFMIFAAMVLFLIILFIPTAWQGSTFKVTSKIPFLGKQMTKTLSDFWAIGQSKKNVLYLIFLSMFTQTLNIIVFWTLAQPFFQYSEVMLAQQNIITLAHGFTFIPLGFLVIAVPIFPAGIGSGHLAFNYLFSSYGVTNGASLFNFYLMITIFMNVLGIVPYLTSKRYSKKEIEEFSETTTTTSPSSPSSSSSTPTSATTTTTTTTAPSAS
ncbi:MAG: flippase-like domain-containing protein [Oligoflexia bacterium]|nr:flippase-like domain-containing protein [Oligoflexia bacterium]